VLDYRESPCLSLFGVLDYRESPCLSRRGAWLSFIIYYCSLDVNKDS